MCRIVLPKIALILAAIYCTTCRAAEDRQSRLARIPRVDVHAHVGGDEALMDRLVEVGGMLKEQHGANLEIWIDLGSYRHLKRLTDEDFDAVEKKYKGRLLPCISDYRIADGLQYSPEEIERWHGRGVAGYKIWVGVSGLSDTPANEATYATMERLGLLGASVHVSQPYPTKWCTDIVKFWEAQNAWERVLDRHPKMTVVMAHMMNYNMTDEQLDYLRYVLEAIYYKNAVRLYPRVGEVLKQRGYALP